ncbi:hypothetical protein QS306_05315 [Paraburkholderia bonniea]|uniref:hypothetical protein n=1 Tax=Paraburkholderia bonniea TaxID=2152891 RepID=UPI001291C275|nr:hypothetical protein [Paraburkholderia bonniea]WJF91070.1 hypothetical protein QS306_05315 [Paraburkholderia bonniea]WJF94384.1 hypothetical protein QS308_05320 [Paraburkholderia bonniea]
MKLICSALFCGWLALLSLSSFGATLDAPLACTVSAHRFIGELQTQHLIEPQPMRVESNSINAFRPTSDATLTAFGFRVFAVVGFEKDDPLFRPGDGEPLAASAYGAVVLGSETKVQAALEAAGSHAIVHRVAPFITAIFCKWS